MKKQMKITVILFATGYFAGAAHAEFGVSAGATFNYKADFRNVAKAQGFANNPGTTASGTDHFYDDGYNRVDSSGNVGNLTTYWGYQDASQNTGGSVTMSSAQRIIDPQSSSGEQNEAQPAIEIYWQEDLTENERWNLGLRVALSWQRIDLDSKALYSTTIETVSDTYDYTGILPGAPFDGSFAGPNFLISDVPSRTTTYAAGSALIARRDIHADLFALNLGPTLSFDFTEKLRLTASIGGTIAWIDSEFTYHDESFAQGHGAEQEWLFGAYAEADLQYQMGERWGIFGGVAHTRLEDFDQQVDGRSAQLQFDDSYSVRAGIFFQ